HAGHAAWWWHGRYGWHGDDVGPGPLETSARASCPGRFASRCGCQTVAMAGERAPKLPFWIHQIVEYGIGALLAYQAIHSPRPVVPLLAGLAVILLAATADGPAACFAVVPRPIHRILDIIVLVGLLVVAVVFGDDMG